MPKVKIIIPRKARNYPAEFNPLRVLYAAAINQAARDLVNPGAGSFNRFTARLFLAREAPYIANIFGIPITTVRARVRDLSMETGRES